MAQRSVPRGDPGDSWVPSSHPLPPANFPQISPHILFPAHPSPSSSPISPLSSRRWDQKMEKSSLGPPPDMSRSGSILSSSGLVPPIGGWCSQQPEQSSSSTCPCGGLDHQRCPGERRFISLPSQRSPPSGRMMPLVLWARILFKMGPSWAVSIRCLSSSRRVILVGVSSRIQGRSSPCLRTVLLRHPIGVTVQRV
jgi:hypothetical protein